MNSVEEFTKNDLLENDQLNNLIQKFSSEEEIKSNLVGNISIISIKTIIILKQLYQYGFTQSIIEEFLDNINQYRYAVSLLEKQS
jgi:hypothetical protein